MYAVLFYYIDEAGEVKSPPDDLMSKLLEEAMTGQADLSHVELRESLSSSFRYYIYIVVLNVSATRM